MEKRDLGEGGSYRRRQGAFSVGDIVARRAWKQLLGRGEELASLERLLEADLPRVVAVSGLPGIGKSSLLRLFAARAEDQGAMVLAFDGGALEPTPGALLAALGETTGAEPDVDSVVAHLADLDQRVLLLIDSYEAYRLVDSWLRNVLVPALPANVRLVFADRHRPSPAWIAGAGWDEVFESLELGPLCTADALELLSRDGVAVPLARRVAELVGSHPMALRLAAVALRGRSDWRLDADTQARILSQLTEMVLAELPSPELRRAAEGASLLRRVTRPLMAAMVDDAEMGQRLYEELAKLPFIDLCGDGLKVHQSLAPALASGLQASDPRRHRKLRCAAWRQLRKDAQDSTQGQLWRYTADMLYLIENRVIREAFFPKDAAAYAVEPAMAADATDIEAVITRHEGPEASAALIALWAALPEAFAVVRDGVGRCVGFYCCYEPQSADEALLAADPLVARWCEHLFAEEPLDDPAQRTLFLRRWLSAEEGEVPSDVQAACWLDVKRLYMELRPALRRVYLAVEGFDAYAPCAQQLGFRPLSGVPVSLDGRELGSAMLDFGPASVDGWLAGLAAAELGIEAEAPLLDVAARELCLAGKRVALTPLEFGLLRYLSEREGEAISRDELLSEVWGNLCTKSSNVVDAVVRTLRRKLGDEAKRVQTVTGVGYRYRAAPS